MHILHMHQPEIRDTSRWPESPRRRRVPDLAWNMSHYWRVMCDNSMTCDVWHTRDTRHWAVASRGLWLMPSACGLGTLQISDKIAIDPRVGSMWRQAAAVIRSWHAACDGCFCTGVLIELQTTNDPSVFLNHGDAIKILLCVRNG